MDWDDTKILEAEPGDYITIARKAKGKQDWFAGGITDENKRTATVDCSFLNPAQQYIATVYKDAANAHWDTNPMAYVIEKIVVNTKTKLTINLAPGGGFAISMVPATKEEIKKLKKK
jgi:glucan 1,4-alpha-glucosidase